MKCIAMLKAWLLYLLVMQVSDDVLANASEMIAHILHLDPEWRNQTWMRGVPFPYYPGGTINLYSSSDRNGWCLNDGDLVLLIAESTSYFDPDNENRRGYATLRVYTDYEQQYGRLVAIRRNPGGLISNHLEFNLPPNLVEPCHDGIHRWQVTDWLYHPAR